MDCGNTKTLYHSYYIEQRGQATEIESSKTGFRKIEIKGRLFLVNGTPIKLKGVDRHENWPEVGHAITEAQMIRDLQVIRQGNCNHVRTCHYSDDPRFGSASCGPKPLDQYLVFAAPTACSYTLKIE